MQTQNSLEILALDKSVDSKLKAIARDAADAGEYEVDFIAHIKGKIKIGEDYEQRLVAKANPWALVAVLMSKVNNVTLESVIRQALAADLEGQNVKAAADAAMARLKDETVQVCKGKVTAKLDIVVTDRIDEETRERPAYTIPFKV